MNHLLHRDGTGIRLAGKGVDAAAGAYTGPALSAGADTVVTLTLDPVAGKMILTVGDSYEQELADPSFLGWIAHPDVQWARVNDKGTISGAYGLYGQPLLWTRALTPAERTTLIAYLESLKAA